MLGALAGVGVTELSDSEYTSQADVFVSAPSSGTATDAERAAEYSQEQATNFAQLASRQAVLQPVIEDLGLEMTSIDMREGLNVSVPLNTSLISIRTTDTVPERAAEIANAIAASLATVVGDLEGDAPVSVQLVEEAAPAASASSPRPVLNVLIGILAGLCLGVGAIAVRDAAHASGSGSREG